MAKKLNAYVHVHTEDGVKVYGPDDDVPAEHAKLITNKSAWADDGDEAGDEAKAPARASRK